MFFRDLEPSEDDLKRVTLLGRDEETTKFREFLHGYMHRKDDKKNEGVNTLMIQGSSRQGKTCLLNKILDMAKPYVQVHRFVQTSYERRVRKMP